MNPTLNERMVAAHRQDLLADAARRRPARDTLAVGRAAALRRRLGARVQAGVLVLWRSLVAFHRDTARASEALFAPPGQPDSKLRWARGVRG